MAQLVTKIIDDYHDIMDNRGNPHTNNFLGMSSPFPTMAISLVYAFCVTKVGPALMKNRQPFQLNNMLIIYNAFQVVLSTWLFWGSWYYGWSRYKFLCEPIDYSDNPIAAGMAQMCWWYYMSKFTEFLDTIFFVLRKKNNQITTLHVIHHSIMPVSVWFGVKFYAGGHGTFFGFVNTFVHIVMYSYYLLAALGPRIQPYLWWKRYLTQLQLLQFLLVIIQSILTLFVKCDISPGLMTFIMAHGLMFLILFSNFYYQAYVARQAKVKRSSVHIPSTSSGFSEKKNNIATADGIRQRNVS